MIKKTIRKFCIWCSNSQPKEIRLCTCTDCPLYPFRMGEKPDGKNRLKAIVAKCKDCGEGTAQSITKCQFPDCPLYPYRTGKNPKRKGLGGKIHGKIPKCEK